MLVWDIVHRYVCYDVVANHICISRNVIFFEDQYFFQKHLSPHYDRVVIPQLNVSHRIERFKPAFVY